MVVDVEGAAVAALIIRGLLLGTAVIIFLVRMDLATGASSLSVESMDLTGLVMICG